MLNYSLYVIVQEVTPNWNFCKPLIWEGLCFRFQVTSGEFLTRTFREFQKGNLISDKEHFNVIVILIYSKTSFEHQLCRDVFTKQGGLFSTDYRLQRGTKGLRTWYVMPRLLLGHSHQQSPNFKKVKQKQKQNKNLAAGIQAGLFPTKRRLNKQNTKLHRT